MLAEVINQLADKWWTFLLRGIVALALAFLAFTKPTLMATALVYIFAAYFIISGVVSFLAGLSFTGIGTWWALAIMGVVQTVLGVLMLAEPGVGPLALAYLFALWLVMTGTTELYSAIALRNVVTNEFWWALLGVITLAIGFYVVFVPTIGVYGLVYTVGIYAILAAIALIAFAFRIKSIGGQFAGQQARTST
jgi:uncharacterized membrane protein HdeD (DUF308 family)